MGAIAAKLGGIGEMRTNINNLKKQMTTIEGITNKLKDAGKSITEKSDGAIKAKDQIQS